ncbi:penicillin-binding transpeptidase domain-containing protein [Actinomadura alba]|uniref:Cell division protein FtsI n=1 Tax=Actinomadura alba TaxID=406431 RepID=A0ABR7LQN2_9ACTN|nr:penicillin-binding transpeptidase domain-containing protein [Actinomadura alba]MBC6466889.1 cell division protein FtsI [Actinomadura alba]
MRSRGLMILAGLLAVALLAAGGLWYAQSRGVKGSPEEVSRDYFRAWRLGSLDRMAKLAADPPLDFAGQHRALSRGLSVTSISLTPGPVVADGKDRAHLGYEVRRNLSGRGVWSYRSTLRLGVVDRRWKVLWTPDALYPGLRGAATWRLTEAKAPATAFVDRAGKPLVEGGTLEPYVAELAERFGGDEDDDPGWAVELQYPGEPAQRVKVFGGRAGKKIRTTVDARWQKAAEHAVGAASTPAAVVAIRPSTGEILAVADRLGGRNAFLGRYPPGSTFKVVTAAGLLSDGMSPSSGVDCPATVVTAQRTVRNHDGSSLGRTALRGAFAQSCNTTFARLAVERLHAAKMTAAAHSFGFNGPITPGVGAARGGFPQPGGDAELAEAAFGQGRVEASPLMMAVVAAAVADGTWRSPRMVDAALIREVGDPVQKAHPVPGAAALRTMMRAVVTEGTAARAGLPGGTAGKTGSAEIGGGASHAWFIGYRGDLAFAVFVAGGDSGPTVAAPLAARFLRAHR